MNAAEVSKVARPEAHRFTTDGWHCYRCGDTFHNIWALRIWVCSRVLEIREGTDAGDGNGAEAQDGGHADWTGPRLRV